jgi:hypothetical protein
MPSVSKMLHHHHTQFQKFKSICASYLSALRFTLTRIRGRGTNSAGASSQKELFRPSHEFVPLDDVVVSTFIGSGERLTVAEDIIHLKHDIRQEEYTMQSTGREEAKHEVSGQGSG